MIGKWRILAITLVSLAAMILGDTTVVAVGMGASAIQARNDALRNAVEQGVGVKIFSESVVQNFVAVKDAIISESFGLVTSYKVISETKKDGMYEVKVEAVVSKDVSSKWAQMRVILEQKGNPTVMFCIKEMLDGVDTPASTGESRLVRAFQEDLKFQVIDRAHHEKLKELQKQIKTLEGNYQAVIDAASDQGANLLVIGTLEGKFKGFMDFYGVQYIEHNYIYTTKIIRTDTAQVIAAFDQVYYQRHNSMQYSREAAGRAGFGQVVSAKHVQPLVERLVYTWIHEMQNTGAPVTLVISNAPFSLKRKVVDALKSGSEAVLSADVQRYQSKRLTLRLMSRLSAEDLAEQLEQIPGLPLEVESVTANTIEARYTSE